MNAHCFLNRVQGIAVLFATLSYWSVFSRCSASDPVIPKGCFCAKDLSRNVIYHAISWLLCRSLGESRLRAIQYEKSREILRPKQGLRMTAALKKHIFQQP